MIVKSSIVRTKLHKYLTLVAEGQETIELENNNSLVAVITTKKPYGLIPPITITAATAKGAWSQVIEAASTIDACFIFTNKKKNVSVYLYKHHSYSNIFINQWVTSMLIIKNVDTDSYDKVINEIDKLGKKLACFVALINRCGDITNTPETNPYSLLTDKNLERCEVD